VITAVGSDDNDSGDNNKIHFIFSSY